jgi:hypothetical protein
MHFIFRSQADLNSPFNLQYVEFVKRCYLQVNLTDFCNYEIHFFFAHRYWDSAKYRTVVSALLSHTPVLMTRVRADQKLPFLFFFLALFPFQLFIFESASSFFVFLSA